MNKPQSEFKSVFSDIRWSDNFYKFLQGIFHLYPEDKFHHLLAEKTTQLTTDREIYEAVQNGRKEINGYLEIGSTGRYISELKKHIPVNAPVYLMNDVAPNNRITDIME